MMRIVFLTSTLSGNSLGRTYVLWRIARLGGAEATVIATSGAATWKPLAGSDFAASCKVIRNPTEIFNKVQVSDLLVACKPLPSTLGIGLDICRTTGIPLLLDIDDPDIEFALRWRVPAKQLAKEVLRHSENKGIRKIQSAIHRVPKIVSNPWLQATYGGTVVPHARETGPTPEPLDSTPQPQITFIGTPRGHKGIKDLRAAVRKLRRKTPFRLLITADAPTDAAPWEEWAGTTSLVTGRQMLNRADLVVVPSLPRAAGQLPAKIIDAMMSGRPLIASDVAPNPWAMGGTGLIFRAGSLSSLENALVQSYPLAERRRMAAGTRERAVKLFSEESVWPTFAKAVDEAISLPVVDTGSEPRDIR